jgi:hypothetical protein
MLLTENHTMKAYRGSGDNSSNHSLTWALDGGEWSASRSSLFTLRERAPGTHWIGGWVGPDDVNIVNENMNIIRKITKALLNVT